MSLNFTTHFSIFGSSVVAFRIFSLSIYLGFYTFGLRSQERLKFYCQSSTNVRYDCWLKYYEQYNPVLPLHAFVSMLLSFHIVVCFIYSCCVRSRVNELQTALKADPENPRRRPRVATRRVFLFYSCHLLVRLVWGILLAILQKVLFYPSGFPGVFVCVSSLWVKPTVNSSNTTYDVNCVNNAASDKFERAVWITNILFALLVLVELVYLIARARRRKEFTFDSEFCLRYFFRKRLAVRETALLRNRLYRENVEIHEEVLISERDVFVNCVICQKTEQMFNDLLKRHEIHDLYLKPPSGFIVIRKLDELFLPNEDTKNPCKILVVGRAGIGKSSLCTKVSHEWINDDLLSNSSKSFEHFYLFQFKWFNTENTKKLSLKQLLNVGTPGENTDSKVFQDVLHNPEKVLLVFDGLDEFNYLESSLEGEGVQFENGPTVLMPFFALYLKLVKGDQLNGATVLTTCRLSVIESVSGLPFDRIVAIMGFTPENIQQYVHNFCAEEKNVDPIWQYISSSSELLSLCHIPMNSFIVCSLLEELQETQPTSSLQTTLTGVFEKILRLFIFKYHPEVKGKSLKKDDIVRNDGFSDPIEETLNQVGSLARKGIRESRLVFDSTEVKGMKKSGLLYRIPESEISPFVTKSHFRFIHLTIQEFLAAREIAKMEPKDLSSFIESNASDPKWHLVIQFVAGLLCGQENEAVNTFGRVLCDSLTEEPPLKDETKKNALLMMKCLQEYNNETTVEHTASQLQNNSKFCNTIDLSKCQVTPIDCTAIAYFMKHLHEVTELNLSRNNITDQGASDLCTALMEGDCRFAKLNLGDNNIADEGAYYLSNALKHEHCKLKKLNLSKNNITDVGVSHLCESLRDLECRLTTLNLAKNKITDVGVLHLCDALRHENWTITKLNLQFNKYITSKGEKQLLKTVKKSCQVVMNPL